MITISRTQFDFQMEDLSFAQTLYGRWDDFCRASFEKVVDDVLSRYDNPDMLIRLETLTLDLGTLSEEDFYEQFPRLLARRLDEIFSAYLANQEAHRGEINVLPIKKSYVDRFGFYLLHGYLSWEEEARRWDLSDFLHRVLEEDPEELLAFLHRHGGKLPVRNRLVLQFPDPALYRLAGVTVPSDNHFIQTFVRFLIESHKRLERPDIQRNDYRNVVWHVVWAYLLSESKGYYSRKQFVHYTLWQLAARYNLSFFQLIDLLTSGLHEFRSVRLVTPELLTLLADIRQEEWLRSHQEAVRSERLSLEQLIARLSVAESCRKMLRNQPETVIYGWVEKIIPFESPFVIGYAQALDREKENGLLEGKAGDEFRLVKWEFIFQVLLGAMGDSFNRPAFAHAVLRQLAAHYNLEVGELLTYFYTTLVAGQVQVDHRIRELIMALFLETAATGTAFSIPCFPSPLTETLGNMYLCRRFLRPLPEEKIYKLVEQIIPSESTFIVHYAQTLDKGKEENALAGKAGAEFRILKWEFIFLVLLQAPLSSFSRRQFARSVLQQIAAHYNLHVVELIRFFYVSLQTDTALFSSAMRTEWLRLFEEMEKESPELLLTVKARTEWEASRLEAFLAGRGESGAVETLEIFVRKAVTEEPDVLMQAIRCLRRVPSGTFLVKEHEHPEAARILALLLQFVIRRFGLNFPRQSILAKELEAIVAGRSSGDPARLRWLLYDCINERAGEFQQVLDGWLKKTDRRESGSGKESAGESMPEKPGDMPVTADTLAARETGGIPSRSPLEPQTSAAGSGKEKRSLEIAARTAAGLSADTARRTGEIPGAVSADIASFHPEFSYRWLQRNATAPCRTVVEELLRLMDYVREEVDVSAWLSFFLSLTDKTYTYYSLKGLLEIAWEKLQHISRPEEVEKIRKAIRLHPQQCPGLAGILAASAAEKEPGAAERPPQTRVYIRNAGLVLLAPYFPRLFSMLHLLDATRRLNEPEKQVKAIFCMQYLATAEKEMPEYELFLNKLLSGYPLEESFSPFPGFEEPEKQILLSLLNSVKQNWNQMKNTSVEGFRNSFLLRDGVLEETEKQWLLTVEPRAYDLLLDTLPWSYSPVKFSWMNKPIYVKWR